MKSFSPTRFLIISGIIWLLVWFIGIHLLVTTQLSLFNEFSNLNSDIMVENRSNETLSLRATIDMYILGYLSATAGAILSTGVSYALFLWTKQISRQTSTMVQ